MLESRSESHGATRSAPNSHPRPPRLAPNRTHATPPHAPPPDPLPATEPAISPPPDQRHRDQHVDQTGTEDSDDRNRQEQTGKGQQRVDQPADDIVSRPAEITCDGPQERTDCRRDKDNG